MNYQRSLGDVKIAAPASCSYGERATAPLTSDFVVVAINFIVVTTLSLLPHLVTRYNGSFGLIVRHRDCRLPITCALHSFSSTLTPTSDPSDCSDRQRISVVPWTDSRVTFTLPQSGCLSSKSFADGRKPASAPRIPQTNPTALSQPPSHPPPSTPLSAAPRRPPPTILMARATIWAPSSPMATTLLLPCPSGRVL